MRPMRRPPLRLTPLLLAWKKKQGKDEGESGLVRSMRMPPLLPWKKRKKIEGESGLVCSMRLTPLLPWKKNKKKIVGESGLVRLTPLLLTWKKRGKREKKNEGNSSLRLPLAPAFLLTATHPEKKNGTKNFECPP